MPGLISGQPEAAGVIPDIAVRSDSPIPPNRDRGVISATQGTARSHVSGQPA
jgi:hypothetical protein